MSSPKLINEWLADPLPKNVRQRIERMAVAEDVLHLAVMPDAHLSADYCVGTVVATSSRIYPHAIGGDIGCGMAAVRVETDAGRIADDRIAAKLLAVLGRIIPSNRHCRESMVEKLPSSLSDISLSDPRLDSQKQRDGRVQFGTLGRGNHFLEFQSDHLGQLWLMIHSGSRGMGQAITTHHIGRAIGTGSMPCFIDSSEPGRNYLHDVAWATEYARLNRLRMLWTTAEVLEMLWSVSTDSGSLIESDHNHVRRESHFGREMWIHRKGAQSAVRGELGIIPGSMGTASYHVLGLGCIEALQSSSHGAGRKLSRTEARQRIRPKDFQAQMRGVYFDQRKANLLRDESPSSYKDIRRIMKAQQELVRSIRELQPILSYKGT